MAGACHETERLRNERVVKMKGHVVAGWMLGLVAFLAFDGRSALAAPKPLRVDSGWLEGVGEGGLTVYKGVPFAAAPIGNLRWHEPQPPAAWSGTRKADSYAPACMQSGVSMPGETPPAVSEDCLYLNLWVPKRRGAARLPVLVWIHGGGYANGSASMPLYRGDRLAQRGVIVVTVAYRLGVLGFLAHPELTRESAHATSGNYGLLDQVAALRWIRRNIAALGGDPARVTIAGQSAGAMSVSLLMASPQTLGLFQGAIAQSGGVFEPLQLAPSYLLANAEHDGEKYAASIGAGSLSELRALPASKLLEGDAGMIGHPVIEPYLLPVAPYDVFASGHQADVPVLLGSNADEARALTDVSRVKAATFAADLEHSFGPLPAAIVAAYPHGTDAQARQARLDLERDLRFGWDMWAWARLSAGSAHASVYFYNFEQSPPFPAGSVYQDWGASHYAELWYVFDHLDQTPWAWTPGDRRLAASMAGYWSNFAKSGNPNGPGLPTWPAYRGNDAGVMLLRDPPSVGGVPGLDRLRVFDSTYEGIRAMPPGGH